MLLRAHARARRSRAVIRLRNPAEGHRRVMATSAQDHGVNGDGSRERPLADARALTVAVTGASGTVGSALLHRLCDCAQVGRVRVLGRHRTSEMPSGIEFHHLDVRDAEAVRRGVAGADVVVHMAFALYGVTPGESELFATNVEGTSNVVRASVESGAARFVYISSAAVYGFRSDNPQWQDEDADVRASARHFYSRHKAQAELVVSEALEGGSTEGYLFRPCAIAGPHAAGAIVSGISPRARSAATALLRAFARGGLRPFAPAPPVPLQFVHEDDVAQALELAIRGEGEPGVYNLAAADAVGGREVLELLGLRVLPVPRTVIQGVLRAVASLPALVPAVVWPALVTEPLLIDASKAYVKLGWRPGWSSRATLRSTRAALGW